MTSQSPSRKGFLDVGRLSTLTDGVFAIAMTVLALELTNSVEIGQALPDLWPELWPKLVAYVMSFMILGLFWIGHHAALSSTAATDRGHVALNLLFLMLIAAIPFPAALVGTHPENPWAFAVYGGTLAATAICLELTWWYAARSSGEHSEGTEGTEATLRPHSQALGKALLRRLLVAIASYGIAVALAFVQPWLGFAAFFVSHATLVVVPFARPRQGDR